MATDHAQLPGYTKLPPHIVELYARLTRDGNYDYTKAERVWMTLQPTLNARGYYLRPRYRDNWTPSWLGTNIDPTFCEDSIRPPVCLTLEL